MANIEADTSTEIRHGILILARPLARKVWLSEEEEEIACSWREKTRQSSRRDQDSPLEHACQRFEAPLPRQIRAKTRKKTVQKHCIVAEIFIK